MAEVLLAERSLLTPEDLRSNPVIGSNLCKIYLLLTVKKEAKKKKRQVMAARFNKTVLPN